MRRERIKSLRLEGITQVFEGQSVLFENVDFEMTLGKTISIGGEAGAGKSFLLKIFAGLEEPVRGRVIYNGKHISDMTFDDLLPLRSSTAFCFENGGLLMNKTLLENLKLPLLFHKQWRAERSQSLLDELVKDFELGPFLNLRPASVSAGVRKITGLVRCFLSNAQILFLDEPSLGLGDGRVKVLNYWINKYRQEGKPDDSIIMTSSDERFVSSIHDCERYVITNRRLEPFKGSAKAAS